MTRTGISTAMAALIAAAVASHPCQRMGGPADAGWLDRWNSLTSGYT